MGRCLVQYQFGHQHFQSRSSLRSLLCHLWQQQGRRHHCPHARQGSQVPIFWKQSLHLHSTST
jgi:hypothetical protein